jgi:phage terminase large subunit-like protein
VAKRQGRLIQLHLERKRIAEDFGITKDAPWKRDEFYIKELGVPKDAPVVFIVAGDGGMTGFRFDYVIFDDLLVKKNQKTETLRIKLMEWIDDEVMGAGEPGFKTIVTGTRKHHKDWYSVLLKDELYSARIDKAIQEDGSFLWPWLLDKDGNKVKCKFDKDELQRRKRKHGPRSFAQEYMNEVAPAEGLLLKREWIQHHDGIPPQQFLDIHMGIDPSGDSVRERSSSLAVAVIAFDRRVDHQKIYVVEMFKKRMSRVEQIEKINEIYGRWKPQSVNIEGVFADKHLAQHIKDRLPNVNIVHYMHAPLKGISDKKKEERIRNYIGVYFEDGLVSLPDPNYDSPTREFIETEYIEFPDGEKDMLDALNLAIDLVDIGEAGGTESLYAW